MGFGFCLVGYIKGLHRWGSVCFCSVDFVVFEQSAEGRVMRIYICIAVTRLTFNCCTGWNIYIDICFPSILWLPFIPLHTVAKLDLITTKNIQGTSVSKVHPPTRQLLNLLQVVNTVCPSSVGCWNSNPVPERLDKVLIDTSTEAFDVRSMDQELAAVRREEV